MAATDPVITLAYFLKFEAPDGDVRLSDGGMLSYASEKYESFHSVFGSLLQPEAVESSFGDMAESGTLSLIPNPDATVSDWWRDDLYDCRVRLYEAELDSDGYTASTATLLGDLLVDTVERRQGANGENVLTLELMGRQEKLFLLNEGNVCSERFHKTVWPGENGFNNCTEVEGFFAWGAASPPRSAPISGGGGFGSGGGFISPYHMQRFL